MRDINQALLDPPYDDGLKAITHPFGRLLRAVIDTIDQHGLQQQSLVKPHKETTHCFRSLTAQSFHSAAAAALRARLLKYQDKLFTFLHYDGVPWKNNHAEHAIKQLASDREHTAGMLREHGLREYLVLLRLCQTCRYNGVSFLPFLLAQARDVDTCCERQHQKRPSPPIALSPKGCSHPYRVPHKRLAQRTGKSQGERETEAL